MSLKKKKTVNTYYLADMWVNSSICNSSLGVFHGFNWVKRELLSSLM
jgi:hypothetical protein